MKSNKVALIAILLWAITIGLFAWFMVRGNTVAGSDNRTAVVLSGAERGLILSEMRGLLEAVHHILDGLNRQDMQQVAAAARKAGMGSAADVNPALMTKLPLPFKQLGMDVHHDMDDLAKAAENGQSVVALQGMLTQTLSKCTGCHSAWQLKAEN